MLLNVIATNLTVKLNKVFGKLIVSRLPAFSTSSIMSFREEKDKYLNMSKDEKRQQIAASKLTTLDQILKWPAFGEKVTMWQGDITTLEIDAIVNAANSSLLGGGGVDGAIHSTAGPTLKKECATLGGCKVGEAKITGGYKLPAKYVIHTVGPRGEKPEDLKQCYLSCLDLAKQNDVKTIAFPCISTGIYGYPQRPAAEVALTTVKNYLKNNADQFERIIFCVFLPTDKDIYEELLPKYFSSA